MHGATKEKVTTKPELTAQKEGREEGRGNRIQQQSTDGGRRHGRQTKIKKKERPAEIGTRFHAQKRINIDDRRAEPD